jgi:hypothetical protein
MRRAFVVCIAVALLGATFFVGIAQAASCRDKITVTDPGDNGGKGQLRRAIADVCDGGRITIRAGLMVGLQLGPLVVPAAKTVTVLSPHGKPSSATATTIDGQGASRVVQVEVDSTLTLQGLTIRGGSDGGVWNHGTLTLVDTAVTGNGDGTAAGAGISMVPGGPGHSAGALTLVDSTITDNWASTGGGIYIGGIPGLQNAGPVILNGDSSISGNRAEGGGGIFALFADSVVTLNDHSTISDNTGGGIATNHLSAVILNDDSTVSANDGPGISLAYASVILNDDSAIIGNTGGGILGAGPNWSVTLNHRSTISGNDGGGISGGALGGVTLNDSSSITGNTARLGGGIHLQYSSATLNDNSSISGNHADDGGGIYVVGYFPHAPQGAVTLNDTSSITGNTASGHGGGIYNSTGWITVNGSATITGNIPDDCHLC